MLTLVAQVRPLFTIVEAHQLHTKSHMVVMFWCSRSHGQLFSGKENNCKPTTPVFTLALLFCFLEPFISCVGQFSSASESLSSQDPPILRAVTTHFPAVNPTSILALGRNHLSAFQRCWHSPQLKALLGPLKDRVRGWVGDELHMIHFSTHIS